MRRTVRLLTTVTTLMTMTVALVLAASACGGGDGGTQTQQEEKEEEAATTESAKGQEDPTQEEQPTQQDTQVEPAQETATVEITGNVAYHCTVGLIDSSRIVEGRAPAIYKIKLVPAGTSLDAVMAVCQKTAAGGPLGVRILYDGEVKAHQQTTGRLGTVAVSWSPVEE